MCWRCSAAHCQTVLHAVASTGFPTGSRRSSRRHVNSPNPENGHRFAGEVRHSEVGPKTTIAARPSSPVNSRFPEVSALVVSVRSATADRVPCCRSFVDSRIFYRRTIDDRRTDSWSVYSLCKPRSRFVDNSGRTGRLMNEVWTIGLFRVETILCFAPGNTSVGRTQRGYSRSTPGEPAADALMARGLSSRDPTHRARSKSLNYRNSRGPQKSKSFRRTSGHGTSHSAASQEARTTFLRMTGRAPQHANAPTLGVSDSPIIREGVPQASSMASFAFRTSVWASSQSLPFSVQTDRVNSSRRFSIRFRNLYRT